MSSALEQVLMGLWRELLAVPAVAPDDNFFDLGGNSILMIRFHSMLNSAVGRAIPLVELFHYPTVGTLAEWLRATGTEGPVEPLAPDKAVLALRRPTPAASVDSYEERASRQLAARRQLRARAYGDRVADGD